MKKILPVFFAWMLLAPLTAATASENGPVTEVNLQLRDIFSGLVNPYPSVNYFYELSAHVIDSAYFDVRCSLPTSCNLWYYAYKELMWCAYDTTWMEPDIDVYKRANNIGTDTVFIGIIDVKYLTLDSKAISSGEYFYADTINNILYSQQVDQRPAYHMGEMFMSSPIVTSSNTRQPTFAIDPSFFFIDNALYDSLRLGYSCYINFDDSLGNQLIDMNNASYFHVVYSTGGIKTIKTYIVDNQSGDTIKSSISEFLIGDMPLDEELEYVDRSSEFHGLYVYEFGPNCSNGMLNPEKYVFILSGYNAKSFLRNRTVSELHKKYIIDGHRDDLLDFGYKIIIVDYEDANRAIQENAACVMQLLEDYKCSMSTDEQFVVIGESMGGLIGRYALTRMEADDYVGSCTLRASQRHNTRLFITNDTPHLGANIPLSIQEIYGIVLDRPIMKGTMKDLLNAISLGALDFRQKALDGISVKQMLLYHYQTENNEIYQPHALRNDFVSSLHSIGDYPKRCKTMALSNGSLLGANQQQCYDSLNAGQFRQPNDVLFDLNTYIYFRVFGFRFSTSLYIDLKTNPDGGGNLLMVNLRNNKPKFSLKPWGLDVLHRDTTDMTRIDGQELLPYCVSSGGAIYLGENHYFGNYRSRGFDVLLGIFGMSYDADPGHITFRAYYGLPWIFEIGMGFDAYSDGFGFTLVPIHSALNYTEPLDLARDYTQLPINQLFSNTIFDVVGGRFLADDSHRFNGNHEDYRNIIFRNVVTGTTKYVEECDRESRILNREVGDVELYLNNDTVAWPSEYSILGSIYANYEHPYYDYDGKMDYTYWVPGFYQRNNPYVVLPSIPVQYNYTQYLEPKDVDKYFEKQNDDWYFCCEGKDAKSPSRKNIENDDCLNNNDVIIYPNPVEQSNGIVMVNAAEAIEFHLYDINGLLVYSTGFQKTNIDRIVYLPCNLLPGSYVAEVIAEKVTRQLLIVK